MRYFFDTEFSGDTLLSAALVREDGMCVYLVEEQSFIDKLVFDGTIDPWVAENVLPIMSEGLGGLPMPSKEWGGYLADFIYRDPDQRPQIISDWPIDIVHFCNLLLTGPGVSHPMLHQTHFTVLCHIDVYPTTLAGAVQHHAYWDAMALRQYVKEMEAK